MHGDAAWLLRRENMCLFEILRKKVLDGEGRSYPRYSTVPYASKDTTRVELQYWK